MGHSDLEITRLITVTLNLLNKKLITIEELESLKLETNRNNVWFRISFNYFGNYNYKDALNIQMWWKRNTKNYCASIKRLYDQKKKIKLEIFLNSEDVVNLKNFEKNYRIYKNDSKTRKKFSQPFDDYISRILQNYGIKCWLRCKYNWFNEFSLSHSYWRGLFKCISTGCNQEYSLYIDKRFGLDTKNVIIIVEFENNTCHIDKIDKNIRVFGEKRREEAVKINSNGVLNYTADNFIENLALDENGNY